MKYILFTALFAIINSLINEDILQNHFSAFKQNYNKSYANIEEEEKRFDVFKKNYEKYGYVNEFSDVVDYEEALKEFKRTKKLPESINYSNILGGVKAQYECGFCYAFSFIAQIEAQFFIKYQKSYRFSEQELLDCSNNIINCNGGNSDQIKAFLSIRNYLALENQYMPYTGKSTPSQCNDIKDPIKKYSSTIKLKVDKVEYLLKIKNRVNCIKALLVKYGPIGAAIRAEVFENYKKGDIINYAPYKCEVNKKNNHAITIVGYDTYYDQSSKRDVSYWIIRNSYGYDFGDNGYAKIKIGDNICGIEDNIHYVKISWDSWCGEGCDECNYYSQNNNLVCNSCISGFRYDYNFKKCYKCREGCESCTNSYDCQKCNDGYYLTNNQCIKCFRDCKKCTGPYENQCYEWYFGESEDTESYVDKEIEENCICYSKYLYIFISFIILFLLP